MKIYVLEGMERDEMAFSKTQYLVEGAGYELGYPVDETGYESGGGNQGP